MDEEKDFQFKDKEIDEISAALAKANKRQFGGDFAAAQESIKAQEGEFGAVSKDLKSEGVTISNNLSQDSANLSDQMPSNTEPKPEMTRTEAYSIIKPLRTYERDMAEAIRDNQESIASINIKKQKQLEESGQAAPKVEKVAKSSLTIFLSLLLVVAGTGIVALIYYFLTTRPEPTTPATPTVISTNETRSIDITGIDQAFATAEIARTLSKPSNSGDIVRIELVEGIGEKKKPITAEKFFEIFAPGAPPSLSRALGGEWLFGFLNASSTEPFIFTTVNSFENTFDGMIRWENKMPHDLMPIFAKENVTFKPNPDLGSNFEDTIIRSKDVRILRDTTGNVALLYSFLDPRNLVITTNEQTFIEILNRFLTSQIIR